MTESRTRVHFWSADFAGCAAYRCRWPSQALNEHHGDSLDVTADTVMSREQRDRARVVVGQRVVLPGPSHFWREWSEEGDKLLIYEVDDDLFSVPASNVKASGIFNSPKNRDRLIRNLLASDYVTVSTEPLKDTVHRVTGFPRERIVVIPNALPPELVLSEEQVVERWEKHSHALGYLASPTHDRDFKMVQRHVRRLLENNAGASFHTIGTDYSTRLDRPGQTRHSDWFRRPEDAIAGIDYRVSIAPLEAGIFSRSKSNCKWVEASARGAVSIVSDVPAYASVIHAETGYKVTREHEWGKALASVYGDPVDSLRVVRNANRYVRENHTTDRTVSLWHEVLTRDKP